MTPPGLSGRMAHPLPDEFLLDYAAGAAPEPIAVLVASHVELTPASRRALRQLEAAGGALLEGVEPARVSDSALERALARLGPQEDRPRPRDATPPSDLPAALSPYIPHGRTALRWRGFGGFAFAELPCAEATSYRLNLLRVAPGRAFPRHGHGGMELLLVLEGGFSDERGHYLRGDVCLSDETVEHRPVADRDGECLCLAVTQGPVRFKGILGFLLAPFTRQP